VSVVYGLRGTVTTMNVVRRNAQARHPLHEATLNLVATGCLTASSIRSIAELSRGAFRRIYAMAQATVSKDASRSIAVHTDHGKRQTNYVQVLCD